ncbi:hypothetical protein Acsp02_82210 [Actinoplanes sp. NBRC 103695]|nr:hypothetical protein Acsp02_82210 [Actinoplanes sp. NBRC 103695]
MQAVRDRGVRQPELPRHGGELRLGRPIEPGPRQEGAVRARTIQARQSQWFGRAPTVPVDRAICEHLITLSTGGHLGDAGRTNDEGQSVDSSYPEILSWYFPRRSAPVRSVRR